VWKQIEDGQLKTSEAIKEALKKQTAAFGEQFSDLRASFEDELTKLGIRGLSNRAQAANNYAAALRKYRQALQNAAATYYKAGNDLKQEAETSLKEGEHDEAKGLYEDIKYRYKKALEDIPPALQAIDPLFEKISKSLAAVELLLQEIRTHMHSEQRLSVPQQHSPSRFWQ